MPKRRRPALAAAAEPTDAELAEFAEPGPGSLPSADPAFRERLRAELWELLDRLSEDEPKR